MTEALAKFSSQFQCPKCGSDKCGVRLDTSDASTESRMRRTRLGWPQGEIMVQTCQICGNVKISRPLDYQEPKVGGA